MKKFIFICVLIILIILSVLKISDYFCKNPQKICVKEKCLQEERLIPFFTGKSIMFIPKKYCECEQYKEITGCGVRNEIIR